MLARARARGDPGTATRMAFALWRFWQKHGDLGEARRRLDALAAAPWSKDDPRLRAKVLEALGGVCWWQADMASMTTAYEEALAIWLSIGDEREIANAYYNAAFTYSISAIAPGGNAGPEVIGLSYINQARERFHAVGDEVGEANALWALGNYHYFRRDPDNVGIGFFREALEIFQRHGDQTMAGWARHMLGSSLLRRGETDEARTEIVGAMRQFHAAGDVAGLTLTLDDLSALAVTKGDLVRAARLRGAARNLGAETGAALAGFVEDAFEQGTRPSVRQAMAPEDVERYGAEGAAMTLDEAIAYALEDDGPADGAASAGA